MDMSVLGNGWTKIKNGPKLVEFWLMGYPIIEDEQERMLHEYAGTGRRSPILDAGDGGGIGVVQWVNYTHDRAVILVPPPGGWKRGGPFRAWVSPGMGKEPFETQVPVHLQEGDPSGWMDRVEAATEYVEQLLGLPAEMH